MFKKLQINNASQRILEEQLYEQVVYELSQGQQREGLWAKAIANSDGSKEKAKALYLKYRVQSMKDESEVILAKKKEIEKGILKVQSNKKFVGNVTANQHIVMIDKMYSLGWNGVEIVDFFNRHQIKCLIDGKWTIDIIQKILTDFKIE